MKKKKKIYSLISITIFIILATPFFINILFKTNSFNELFVAEWTAGEALMYTITSLSVLATSCIAYIAVNQNKKLLDIEERNLIKNNSTLAHIIGLEVKDSKNVLCNAPLYNEQILYDKSLDYNKAKSAPDYRNFSIIFNLSFSGSYPTKVDIKNVLIITNDTSKGKENNKVYEFIKFIESKTTSIVAISNNIIRFEAHFLLSSDDKKCFIENIKNKDTEISIDLDLELINNISYSSKIKCRSNLSTKINYNKIECISNDKPIQYTVTETFKPMCFWKGIHIIKN